MERISASECSQANGEHETHALGGAQAASNKLAHFLNCPRSSRPSAGEHSRLELLHGGSWCQLCRAHNKIGREKMQERSRKQTYLVNLYRPGRHCGLALFAAAWLHDQQTKISNSRAPHRGKSSGRAKPRFSNAVREIVEKLANKHMARRRNRL
jgi:hypothetical protein